MTTEPSMFTFWEMEYPPLRDGLPVLDKAMTKHVLLGKPGHNRVLETLRTLGYQHVRMGPNQSKPQDCAGYEDLCLFQINPVDGSAEGAGGNIYRTLFEMTPLVSVAERLFPASFGAVGGRNTYLKSTIGDAIRVWQDRRDEFTAPYFFEINVWQPHGPYLLDRRCEAHERGIPYKESWNRENPESIDFYSQETACANAQLISLIDRILDNDPEGIVLLQSDHGHGFFTDFKASPEAWTPESIEARSSILWAARLPDSCRRHLYDTVSPVNTFRVVFACLRDEPEADLLPDRVYVHRFEESVRLWRSSLRGVQDQAGALN
jgi:hypothetical protein